jgi:hypothetical protein
MANNDTPINLLADFRQMWRNGGTEIRRGDWSFGLDDYGVEVQRDVAYRRKRLLEKNPDLALNDDSLDAILRNTVTGRLGRARGSSTSTALGQAFDPTAPLGRDTLLGD